MSDLSREKYVKVVEAGPGHRGRKELIAGLNGEELTMKQAIIAFCYSCSGFYDKGKDDTCCWDGCPLNPYMPYSSNKRVVRSGGKGNIDSLRKAREKKQVEK